MSKTTSDALLSKLKESLPKRPPQIPITKTKRVVTPASLEKAKERSHTLKLSMTLYQTDMKRLDEIKEFMKGRGYRNLNDSQAVRLACRAVKIDDQLIGYYLNMQGEDGRRKNDGS